MERSPGPALSPSAPPPLSPCCRRIAASTRTLITLQSVLRIRIHMFLGLPDPNPDPTVRDMDPDPPRIRILLSSSKNTKENIDSVLWLLYVFLSLKNDINIPPKSNKQKNLSISQRYGSADQDPHPDPYKNFMDPWHWLQSTILSKQIGFILYANPDPVSFWPGSGIRNSFLPDPGSRNPNPYFWDAVTIF